MLFVSEYRNIVYALRYVIHFLISILKRPININYSKKPFSVQTIYKELVKHIGDDLTKEVIKYTDEQSITGKEFRLFENYKINRYVPHDTLTNLTIIDDKMFITDIFGVSIYDIKNVNNLFDDNRDLLEKGKYTKTIYTNKRYKQIMVLYNLLVSMLIVKSTINLYRSNILGLCLSLTFLTSVIILLEFICYSWSIFDEFITFYIMDVPISTTYDKNKSELYVIDSHCNVKVFNTKNNKLLRMFKLSDVLNNSVVYGHERCTSGIEIHIIKCNNDDKLLVMDHETNKIFVFSCLDGLLLYEFDHMNNAVQFYGIVITNLCIYLLYSECKNGIMKLATIKIEEYKLLTIEKHILPVLKNATTKKIHYFPSEKIQYTKGINTHECVSMRMHDNKIYITQYKRPKICVYDMDCNFIRNINFSNINESGQTYYPISVTFHNKVAYILANKNLNNNDKKDILIVR